MEAKETHAYFCPLIKGTCKQEECALFIDELDICAFYDMALSITEIKGHLERNYYVKKKFDDRNDPNGMIFYYPELGMHNQEQLTD